MKRILATLLLLTLVAPAWAGWDEGAAAYLRGDYATVGSLIGAAVMGLWVAGFVWLVVAALKQIFSERKPSQKKLKGVGAPLAPEVEEGNRRPGP